ncbi:RAMP superfamily CRISPR-associated protein [Anaerophilus nitritogenes]|uniref:RAMP superfamily CRISPR-associated protein n=1 Tax=Anaerophilus nitritogenes TaxID=2498136 RepID=UPI00101B9624|nr:RAMP superfamily CRISPR-associated protein [Anaerophilus nitritogenes]
MAEKNKKLKEVSLPYDFIPFPEKQNWYYVYKENTLPKHNKIEGLSGRIDYSLDPQTDISLEFRKAMDYKDRRCKHYQISGSSMKGKVRSNLEILSMSYPCMIEGRNMTYRNLSDSKYKDKVNKEGNIEKIIHTGFLKKINGDYYIQPAIEIGNRWFKTIKEDEIIGHISQKNFKSIFLWDDDSKKEFKELRGKINKYTEKIIKIKKEFKKGNKSNKDKEIFEEIIKEMDGIFKKDFNFGKKFNKNKKEFDIEKEANNIKKELSRKLKEIPTQKLDLQELFKLYEERMALKATLYLRYPKMKMNREFHPYQKNIYYQLNENNGLKVIKTEVGSNEKNGLLKGYLYNSTNASSKRSHYIIGEVDNSFEFMENEKTKSLLKIDESIIVVYKDIMKNFRVSPKRGNQKKNQTNIDDYQKEIKAFYDIFDEENHKELQKKYKEGIIVFYRTDGENKVTDIGRTPHMRVSYNNQIENLINNTENKKDEYIDYARALFGYANHDFKYELDDEKVKSMSNYKSRLRFSHMDIEAESDPELISNFTLMTPSPTACAMYIDQKKKDEIVTYDDENVKLNGYKYYKLLDEPIKPKQDNNKESYQCDKLIMKKDNIKKITGSIYFKNINKVELGLLLSSLDANLIKDKVGLKDCEQLFDSIGGAKPYGYGRVKVNIEKVIIDYDLDSNVKPSNIEFWLGKKEYTKENIQECIDLYYKKSIIEDKVLEAYVCSKEIKEEPKINWDNLQNQLGNPAGYKKTWKIKIEKPKKCEEKLNLERLLKKYGRK